MAILPYGCPGIRVSIESQGQPLNEYPDTDNQFLNRDFRPRDDCVSMNYVECVSGAEFAIKFDILHNFMPQFYHTHVTFWVIVDGKSVGGMSPRVPFLGTFSSFLDAAQKRVSLAEVSTRKLKFAAINKVDDGESARVKEDIKLADGLGEIIVHVHRTCQVPHTEPWYDPRAGEPYRDGVQEISEKALKGKAISHSVALGPEQRQFRTRELKTTYPDGYSHPMAIFVFRYRSREDLQQEMIIPRSETPEVVAPRLLQLKQDRVGYLASLKNEYHRVKTEIGADEPNGSSSRGQKRVHDLDDDPQQGRAYKTSRGPEGEVVIDLTDD